MSTFYLDFNVTGEERKRLVRAIASYMQADAKYLGVPSCAYQVDRFTIDRKGCVSFDDRDEIDGLIEQLVPQGFVALVSNLGMEDDEAGEPAEAAQEAATAPDSADTEGLTISLPIDGFSETSIDNLKKLVAAKAALIRKALNADRLDIEMTDDRVSFPWWDRMPEHDETQAYMNFIVSLCKMAKEARRVNARESEVESEKYAFRCFLLRLGFIGSDCKAQRKILMKHLSGTAAFPTREKADAFSATLKARRDAANATKTEEVAACE